MTSIERFFFSRLGPQYLIPILMILGNVKLLLYKCYYNVNDFVFIGEL